MKDFISRSFEKNPLIAWRAIGGVVLLVPMKQPGPEITRLYRLKDSVSARIWELVDGKKTVQEILQVVCQEFDVKEQRAKRDLLKFLRHLKSVGVIQFVGNSAGKKESAKPKAERKALRLSIGGVGFSLQWEEPREVNWPHPLYEPFTGEESETIRLEIYFEGGPKLNGQKLLFDGENHWKLYQQDSRYLFEAFDPSNQTTNMLSLINRHFNRAEVYVKPGPSGSPPPWSLPRLMNPLGQWLLINRLAQTGGVMVHALGIDDRGQGRVFVGPSGAGKSTLARFWLRRKGVRILSDEHLILRRQGRRFYAYGTPWPGMAARVSQNRVEIQQIFFIEHHPEHRMFGESGGTLVSRLFSQLFLPRWNERIIESGAAVCEELVQKVQCQRLGFAKDPNVIDFVRQVQPGEKNEHEKSIRIPKGHPGQNGTQPSGAESMLSRGDEPLRKYCRRLQRQQEL